MLELNLQTNSACMVRRNASPAAYSGRSNHPSSYNSTSTNKRMICVETIPH